MDFQTFKNLNLSEISKWKKMKLSDDEIDKWRNDGSLVEKLYELKMKKVYLEYIKIKLQNMLSAVDPFSHYDPIKEAETILKKFSATNGDLP